jgi:ferrous iron transport protein A
MLSESLLPLEMLRPGEWADVAEVCGDACWIGRMAELGIRTGSRVQLVQEGTPCLLNVGGCRLCLRGDACSRILVRPLTVAHG